MDPFWVHVLPLRSPSAHALNVLQCVARRVPRGLAGEFLTMGSELTAPLSNHTPALYPSLGPPPSTAVLRGTVDGVVWCREDEGAPGFVCCCPVWVLFHFAAHSCFAGEPPYRARAERGGSPPGGGRVLCPTSGGNLERDSGYPQDNHRSQNQGGTPPTPDPRSHNPRVFSYGFRP